MHKAMLTGIIIDAAPALLCVRLCVGCAAPLLWPLPAATSNAATCLACARTWFPKGEPSEPPEGR